MAKTKKNCIIIGFGSAARGWLREIRKNPSLDIIGIVDTDTELLENIGSLISELDDDQAYISIEDAVKYGEKPDLAVILNCFLFRYQTLMPRHCLRAIRRIQRQPCGGYRIRKMVAAMQRVPSNLLPSGIV